jgi:hypothetical protein
MTAQGKWWPGKDRGQHEPTKPMKYTAIVQRIREITVEAETNERATVLFRRRLEPEEKIISVQTNLL